MNSAEVSPVVAPKAADFDPLRITGVIPAMLTPMTANGDIDERGIRSLVRYLMSHGVNGVFVLGSSGEFSFLLPEERASVIRIVVDEVGGRLPVLAGVSDSGTKRVIENVKVAADAGADVAVALPPYYMGSTQSELQRHYAAILEATELPILLYNNPLSVGVSIPVELVESLAEHDRIVGIKDSSGDFTYFRRLLARLSARPRFRVVQGHEGLAAVSFLLGAHAGHLGLANVVPSLFVELYEAASAGDTRRALELQDEVDALSLMWSVGGPTDSSYLNSMKAALALLGVCGSGVSVPYQPLSADEVGHVRRILVAHGLLS